MVKKWIVMISLIVVLVVGCILESGYVHSSFSWLINSLETLQIEISQSENGVGDKIDSEYNINLAYQIHEDWHGRVQLLKCLVWHSGIKDVEIGLARIAVYVKEDDYKEASAEIGSLIDYLAHYLDDFSISVENIF